MIAFSVATRELIVAARRPRTHKMRVWFAALGIVIFLWLIATNSTAALADSGRRLFSTLSNIAFFYAILAGVRFTSDCLSDEKRQGTLGLLFLTDLTGHDVVLGKLAASSIHAFYGMMALIPIMTSAVLFGGVTLPEVGWTGLTLLNTLFFSLSVGVFVSAASRNERKALFGTLGLLALWTAGPYVAGAYITEMAERFQGMAFDAGFVLASPWFAFDAAQSNPVTFAIQRHDFMQGLAVQHLSAWGFLVFAGVILPGKAQDQLAGDAGGWLGKLSHYMTYGSRKRQAAHRTQALDRNPYFWLAGRDRLKVAYVWVFFGLIAAIWGVASWKYLDLVADATVSLWFLMLVFGFLKVWHASESSVRWVEEQKSGALELLLCTPLQAEKMVAGQNMALNRQFAKPVMAVIAAAWLLYSNGRQRYSDWAPEELGAALFWGIAVGIVDIFALRWTGRWHGLTAKSANRAIIATVFRILMLPWILFWCCATACIVLYQVGGRGSGPFDTASAISYWGLISMAISLWFGFRNRSRFMRHFREVANKDYAPARQAQSEDKKAAATPKPAALKARETPKEGPHPSLLRRHRKKAIAVAVVALAALAGRIYQARMDRLVEGKILELSKAGYPVDLPSLRTWTGVVKPEENAALGLMEAAGKIKAIPQQVSQFSWPDRRGPINTNLLKALKDLRESNEAVYPMIHRAVQLKKSRYPADWEAGFNMLLPSLGQSRQLTTLLQAKAFLAIREGRADEAWEAIVDNLKVAESLRDEPLLVSQNTRLYELKGVATAAERLLSTGKLGESQIGVLLNLFKETEESLGKSGIQAVAGETCFGLSLFRISASDFFARMSFGASSDSAAIFGKLYSLLSLTGTRQRDELFYLGKMREYLDLMGKPFPERWTKAEADSRGHYEELASHSLFFISRVCLPQMESWVRNQADFLARWRSAEAAITLEAGRLKNGGAEPTMAELARVAGSFADPYTGKGLRGTRLPDGYAVYSVGPDLRDDGGNDSSGAHKDVAFRVRRE